MKRFFLLVFFTCIVLRAEAEDIKDSRAMIERFAPLVKLSSGENYFPSSLPWYFQRAALKDSELNIIKEIGNVTAQDLAKHSESSNYLDPEGNKETYKGQPLVGGKVVVPMYLNYFVIDDNNAVLQALFHYPFNGATSLLKAVEYWEKYTGVSGGNHEGDIEHVDIYITKQNNDYIVDKMFFARHGNAGKYVYNKGKNLNFEGSHPIVYSAKFGHASYEKPFSVVNSLADTADGKGAQWEGWKHYELVDLQNLAPGQEWVKYKGSLGVSNKQNKKSLGSKGSPHGFIAAGWFRKIPHIQQIISEVDVTVSNDKSRASGNFNLSPSVEAEKLIWTVEGADPAISYFVKQQFKYKFDPVVLGPLQGKKAESTIIRGDGYYIWGVKGAKKGDTFKIKIESYY